MSGGASRKGFLRDLLRGTFETFEGIRDGLVDEEAASDPFAHEGGAAPGTAAPAERTATLEELRALCGQAGLAHRADAVAELAEVSFRLTPATGGTSRLGGLPRVPPPRWRDRPLRALLDVDLASLPDGTPLPAHGRLLLFASPDAPSGRSPEEAGAAVVVHVEADEPVAPAEPGDALPEVQLAPSAELVLPPEAESLELTPDELVRWVELREQLAAAQGVELEETVDYHAVHRVLGFPDAIAERMEADADLVARGIDLDAADVLHEEGEAAGWRLLLQVSSDAAATLELPLYERLYVWIHEDDLAARRFDRVVTFVR